MSDRLRPGDPAPEIELREVGGALLRGRDLRGRPALLVFLRHLY